MQGSTSRASSEDGKCYFPCRNCKGLRPRRILIKSTEKHCRDYEHAKGGHEYHSFVSYLLCLFIVDCFCKCLNVYFILDCISLYCIIFLNVFYNILLGGVLTMFSSSCGLEILFDYFC